MGGSPHPFSGNLKISYPEDGWEIEATPTAIIVTVAGEEPVTIPLKKTSDGQDH